MKNKQVRDMISSGHNVPSKWVPSESGQLIFMERVLFRTYDIVEGRDCWSKVDMNNPTLDWKTQLENAIKFLEDSVVSALVKYEGELPSWHTDIKALTLYKGLLARSNL